MNNLTIEPLTMKNWDHFVKLFGKNGACENCWCMYYRLTQTEYNKGKRSDGNKISMKKLVWDDKPTGLLGFIDGEAVAWCAFAPREDLSKLERSRIHKRIDDKPVWSIPCFFIHKKYRRSGISGEILKGAIQYAREKGIKIIEAYPASPTKKKLPDSSLWAGLYKSFERAGFKIVDRKSINRPMVRYFISWEN